MTLEGVALVFVGVVLNGFTFVVGMAVGISLLERKQGYDNSNSDEETTEGGHWHLPLDIGTTHGPQLRSRRGPKQDAEADPAKRADR